MKLRVWASRLKGLFSKHARERELADELESHLQMHIDDNIRAGMSPAEARRVAVMKLGGVDQTKEAYRDRVTIPLLESAVQDLRFTFRQLRKNPAFTITATAMVALGIGASVAIFAFVDAALIKPLPYKDPSRLLYVTETTPDIPRAARSHTLTISTGKTGSDLWVGITTESTTKYYNAASVPIISPHYKPGYYEAEHSPTRMT